MAGDFGTDPATAAFRRLLHEASSQEQARVDALVAFAQRAVFAATWPGQTQAIRTLTNRQGETAMPLFTGLDLLDETATRFGWRNADGTLPMRDLPAREALRHAVARGVHFVVVDISSAHSVEFSREEIEPLLQLQAQGTAGPFAAKGEREAAIRNAVRRSSLPPPMPRAPAAAVEIDAPFARIKKRAPSAALPGAQPTVLQVPAARGSMTVPEAARVTQRAAPPMAASGVSPSSFPEIPSLPPAADLEADEPLLPVLPNLPPAPRVPAYEPPQAAAPDFKPPEMFSFSEAEEEPAAAPANEVAGKTAAFEVAAALTSAAKAAGDPIALQAAAEMSKLLLRNAVEKEVAPPPARPDAAQAAAKRMAALFMGAPMPEDEPAAEPEAPPPPVEPSLELLQAISNVLRGYLEVEWACVMHDSSEVATVGVRVDPSFMGRAPQITDAVIAVAEQRGDELQVLLLSTADLVKRARKDGKAFYPWRR